MKKLAVLALSTAMVMPAYAAKGDVLESEIQKVIEFKDVSKDSIYTGSRQWVAQSFKSAQDVIQMDDKESGIIIAKGNMKYPCTGSWWCSGYENMWVKFTLKIESRDGRARVTFSDIVRYTPASYTAGFKTPESEDPITNYTKNLDTVSQVRTEFENLFKSYEKAVSNIGSSIDDW